jgi:transposase
MHTIQEVLRLTYLSHLSSRQVGLLTNTSQTTVLDYCSRFKKISVPIKEFLEYDNAKVMALLYPEKTLSRKTTTRSHPNWDQVYTELKQKGMTRQLLWEE